MEGKELNAIESAIGWLTRDGWDFRRGRKVKIDGVRRVITLPVLEDDTDEVAVLAIIIAIVSGKTDVKTAAREWLKQERVPIDDTRLSALYTFIKL